MKLFVRKKGYSLIEAVVALAALSILITVSISVILNSIDLENSNKDLLIGQFLAEEGLEAMRNIYYTNLLKFGEENADQCSWVKPDVPPETDVSNCAANKISPGTYIPYRHLSGVNILSWGLGDPMLTPMIVGNELKTDYRLYTTPYLGVEMYVWEAMGDDPTKFYREVVVSENVVDSVLIVNLVSRVGWYRQDGGIRTFEVDTNIPISF